ncbi:TRAP transporter small permease [Halegenticoccus tardaugens]|uniref:TRAP transporter small permease n=1 Tax=Halegenticoccus tardaugens TaxID=2071624 RepID=UPI0013E9306E|nr:TRAP transporter small permease subunit [Halegenticoccus tardaugens]
MEIDQSLDLKRDTWFDAAILYTATALFGLTIVLAAAQVFIRVFNVPTFGKMYWTEPAARFILIVATYLGAAVATRNNQHIAIRYLLDKVQERYPRVGSALTLFVGVVVLIFVSVALQGSVLSAVSDWNTSIGGISFVTSGRLYLGISVGLALMAIYELLKMKNSVVNLIGETSRDESGAVRESLDTESVNAGRSEGGDR